MADQKIILEDDMPEKESGTNNLKNKCCHPQKWKDKWRNVSFEKQIELRFAFAIVLFTCITVIFTAITTCTLKDQLTIMREEMQISTRAWACAIGIKRVGGFEVGKSPTVKVEFSNSGGSPAREVTIKTNMKPSVQPIPDNIPIGAYVSKEPSIGVIAAKGAFSSTDVKKEGFIFTNDSFLAFTKNDLRLYIHGFVDYLDVFDKRHCTYFCFVSRVEGVKNALSFQACANNNEMTDEECKYK